MVGAPHETWLVLDATTGQNAISQAAMFKDIVEISGIVLTKLDGTAKGGIILAICDELEIPVKYIGLGERADDLRPFDPEEFIDALFSKEGESLGGH
jgi:fused signal recognition particle receptor